MNQPQPSNVKTKLLANLLLVSLLGYGISNASATDSDQTKKSIGKAEASQNKAVKGMNKEIGKKKIKKMNKDEQIKLSKQQLAEKFAIDQNGIELTMFESVTWRSGAMGCPKPGMMYTQALVPGVRILLRVDGKIYRYHAASKGKPFYCPNDRIESPSNAAGDT